MPVAGDGHDVGPVVGLHGDAGRVGAGDVEGGGAAAVGALDAGPGVPLPRAALVAVGALLWGGRRAALELTLQTLQGDPLLERGVLMKTLPLSKYTHSILNNEPGNKA